MLAGPVTGDFNGSSHKRVHLGSANQIPPIICQAIKLLFYETENTFARKNEA
jgi:hypothetical protein